MDRLEMVRNFKPGNTVYYLTKKGLLNHSRFISYSEKYGTVKVVALNVASGYLLIPYYRLSKANQY